MRANMQNDSELAMKVTSENTSPAGELRHEKWYEIPPTTDQERREIIDKFVELHLAALIALDDRRKSSPHPSQARVGR